MSFEASLFVAAFIIFAALVAILSVFSARARKAKDEELRQAASLRGWQFETANEKGLHVRRYRGTTDGIPWVAESIRDVTGNQKRRRRKRLARWRTTSAVGLPRPIVCMGVPKGKEEPSFVLAQGESWVAQLSQKAAGFAFDKAIDVYFGDELGREVDAAALRRVTTDLPGFVVMAADTTEAAASFTRGLQAELHRATTDPASILSHDDRPWVLFWKGGVSLARTEEYASLDELESFVRAGVALTRATTFGRSSSF